MLLAGSGDHLADLGDHRVQALRLQMAEVQGHLHFAGYHVARTGIGVQAADRAASMRLMAEGRAIDRLDHRRGTDQGILAQVHRRWPGVCLDAAQGQVEPFLPERAEYHADGLPSSSRIGSRSMCASEIGAHRMSETIARSRVADGVQRLAYADTVGIALGQGLLQG